MTEIDRVQPAQLISNGVDFQTNTSSFAAHCRSAILVI